MARIGLENACAYIAEAVVDNSGAPFSGQDPNASIKQIGTQVMGLLLPDDQPALDVLTNHFTKATAAGSSASQALRSTFVLACLSPKVSQIGL